MSVPEDLPQKIDETRITYPEREHGGTIRGSPFTCEFDEPVDPEAFCDEITTAEEPWKMFGVTSKLAEKQVDEDDNVVQGAYWKVVGNLLHVESGELVGASKISLEVTPNWVRIYVKEECSADRAAEFVRTLDEEYGVEVTI